MGWLDNDGDAVVVAVDEPVKRHHSDFGIDSCSLVHEFAPYEPEAVHPCRYRGPAAGRLAAVAHGRLAARRYYAARRLAEGTGPMACGLAVASTNKSLAQINKSPDVGKATKNCSALQRCRGVGAEL